MAENVIDGLRHAMACPLVRDRAKACDCHPLDESKAMTAEDVKRVFAALPENEAAALRDYLTEQPMPTDTGVTVRTREIARGIADQEQQMKIVNAAAERTALKAKARLARLQRRLWNLCVFEGPHLGLDVQRMLLAGHRHIEDACRKCGIEPETPI